MISFSELHPLLDLVFERQTSLSPEQIWRGWTDPTTLKQWFCPKPWRVTDARVELTPGGEFFNVMEGPNGERVENHGCYLKVIPHQELVWTGLLTRGFRPAPPQTRGFGFVAKLQFIKNDEGTLYRAVVAHSDEEGRKRHEQMGFREGWGLALNQLEELYLGKHP